MHYWIRGPTKCNPSVWTGKGLPICLEAPEYLPRLMAESEPRAAPGWDHAWFIILSEWSGSFHLLRNLSGFPKSITITWIHLNPTQSNPF